MNVLFGTEKLWKWFHGSPPAAALRGELRNTNHAQTGLKTIQAAQPVLEATRHENYGNWGSQEPKGARKA